MGIGINAESVRRVVMGMEVSRGNGSLVLLCAGLDHAGLVTDLKMAESRWRHGLRVHIILSLSIWHVLTAVHAGDLP